jgi:hypothetical protein
MDIRKIYTFFNSCVVLGRTFRVKSSLYCDLRSAGHPFGIHDQILMFHFFRQLLYSLNEAPSDETTGLYLQRTSLTGQIAKDP